MTVRSRIPSQSSARVRRPRPVPSEHAPSVTREPQRSHTLRNLLLVGAVILPMIVGMALFAANTSSTTAHVHQARVDACSWYYGRYSTEWQNCVDAP